MVGRHVDDGRVALAIPGRNSIMRAENCHGQVLFNNIQLLILTAVVMIAHKTMLSEQTVGRLIITLAHPLLLARSALNSLFFLHLLLLRPLAQPERRGREHQNHDDLEQNPRLLINVPQLVDFAQNSSCLCTDVVVGHASEEHGRHKGDHWDADQGASQVNEPVGRQREETNQQELHKQTSALFLVLIIIAVVNLLGSAIYIQKSVVVVVIGRRHFLDVVLLAQQPLALVDLNVVAMTGRYCR